LRARARATLESIAARGARRVIAVTHGGFLDAAYRLATGVADEEARSWELRNASLNTIDVVGDRWQLLGWADVTHLSGTGDEDD
jgi:probable phosphoglycerate mutase